LLGSTYFAADSFDLRGTFGRALFRDIGSDMRKIVPAWDGLALGARVGAAGAPLANPGARGGRLLFGTGAMAPLRGHVPHSLDEEGKMASLMGIGS
jgi:hypothetical protein